MATAAQRRIKSVSYAKYGYIFILPFFIVYCIFSLWPLIQTFILAFSENGTRTPGIIGLDNFKTILATPAEGDFKALRTLGKTSVEADSEGDGPWKVTLKNTGGHCPCCGSYVTKVKEYKRRKIILDKDRIIFYKARRYVCKCKKSF